MCHCSFYNIPLADCGNYFNIKILMKRKYLQDIKVSRYKYLQKKKKRNKETKGTFPFECINLKNLSFLSLKPLYFQLTAGEKI